MDGRRRARRAVVQRAGLFLVWLATGIPAWRDTCARQPEVRSAPETADPFNPAGARDLSGVLAPILEKYKLPCLGGAIVASDRLVAIGAVGHRLVGDEAPVTTSDLFHLGSCTKAMTATLIATLIEEGKLSWTTTLKEALPGLAPRMDPAYLPVTIEQLLTHRAGIPGDLNFDGLWGRLWQRHGTPTEQRAALAEGVLTHKPVHDPGGQFLYANAGFAIAGYIAELRTGKAWEDLMRERVFGPLGMSSAGFGAPGVAGKADQPRGHSKDRTPVEPGPNADNPPAIGPGGTVHCSLADWGRFIALHLRGEKADQKLGDVTLRRETFAKLHTPVKGKGADYAMGWGVANRPWAGTPGVTLTHSGSNTMWFCVCWLAPEKGFAVLVTTNIADDKAGKACDEAASALISDYQKPK